MTPSTDIVDLRPSWKGWIHAVAFPISLLLGAVLIVLAQGAAAITGSAIFSAAASLLFGVSALYHRIVWTPQVKATLRRLDHANIYLLIAGTYTPLSLLLLSREKAIVLLSIVWGGALVGVLFRVFWLGAPRWLYVPIYVALGWVAAIYAPDFFRANWQVMMLVIVGGLLYSIGATIYGLKRPNPLPKTFGYHEIFHALTVGAFLCHWVAVLLVILD